MVLYCPTCHTAYNNNLADKLVHKTDPDYPDVTSNMVFECPKKNCYGAVIMLDDNIVPFVDRLLSLGAITLFSCAGHYEENYYSPYIDILDNSKVCPFTKKLLNHVDYTSTISSAHGSVVKDKDSGPDYHNQLRIECTKSVYYEPRLRFGSDGKIYDVRKEIIIRLPNRHRPISVSNDEYAKERFDYFRSMLEDYLNLYGLIENIQAEATGQKFDTELCLRQIHQKTDDQQLNAARQAYPSYTRAFAEFYKQYIQNPGGDRSLKNIVESIKDTDKQEIYKKAKDVFAIPVHLERPMPTIEAFFDSPFTYISPQVIQTLLYRFMNSTDNALSTAVRNVLYATGIIIDSGGYEDASLIRKRNYILSLRELIKLFEDTHSMDYEPFSVLSDIFHFYNKVPGDDIKSDESSNTPNTKE